MPKMKVELTERDMKNALAFWVDQGRPELPEFSQKRVRIGFSKAVGNDPREYDYHYATVESGEPK